MNLDSLIKKAVGTQEKPASPWTGVLYVFLSVVAIALAALPAILARRKAALMAHELDKLREEKKKAENLALIGNLEDQSKEHLGNIKKIDENMAKVGKLLDAMDEKRQKFEAGLAEVTSWGDL